MCFSILAVATLFSSIGVADKLPISSGLERLGNYAFLEMDPIRFDFSQKKVVLGRRWESGPYDHVFSISLPSTETDDLKIYDKQSLSKEIDNSLSGNHILRGPYIFVDRSPFTPRDLTYRIGVDLQLYPATFNQNVWDYFNKGASMLWNDEKSDYVWILPGSKLEEKGRIQTVQAFKNFQKIKGLRFDSTNRTLVILGSDSNDRENKNTVKLQLWNIDKQQSSKLIVLDSLNTRWAQSMSVALKPENKKLFISLFINNGIPYIKGLKYDGSEIVLPKINESLASEKEVINCESSSNAVFDGKCITNLQLVDGTDLAVAVFRDRIYVLDLQADTVVATEQLRKFKELRNWESSVNRIFVDAANKTFSVASSIYCVGGCAPSGYGFNLVQVFRLK